LNNNLNNNIIKKIEPSHNDAKQYKYESPYLKNANNNVNNYKSPQSILQPKSNNIGINNNLNMRPISSNNQKVVINGNVNIGGNIVNSIKKVAAPERKIGNQIKVAENLIKNNNNAYNYNYNNVKSGNQPQGQNNFLRPSSGNKVDPIRIAGNRNIIKK